MSYIDISLKSKSAPSNFLGLFRFVSIASNIKTTRDNPQWKDSNYMVDYVPIVKVKEWNYPTDLNEKR